MLTSNSRDILYSILQTAQQLPAQKAGRLAIYLDYQVKDAIRTYTNPAQFNSLNATLQILLQSMKSLHCDLEEERLAEDERSDAWLTISEIRNKYLPGLPRSPVALKAYLDNHGITADPAICRKRERTGRGIEYHRSALTRAALAERKKWLGVDIGGLLLWIATTQTEQPNLTPSGLRQAYTHHLRAKGSESRVPSLREFRQTIRFVSKEGR